MTLKIDRHLLAEIRERGERGPYPVTIELDRAVKPVKHGTRAKTVENLNSDVQKYHSDVINLLTSMGIKDFQVLSLSNSIKTSLTADQIQKVANRPDVKIVRLIRSDNVTT